MENDLSKEDECVWSRRDGRGACGECRTCCDELKAERVAVAKAVLVATTDRDKAIVRLASDNERLRRKADESDARIEALEVSKLAALKEAQRPRPMSEAPWDTWILLRVGYEDARQPLEVRRGVKGRDYPRVWIDETGRPGAPDETWNGWWPLPDEGAS